MKVQSWFLEEPAEQTAPEESRHVLRRIYLVIDIYGGNYLTPSDFEVTEQVIEESHFLEQDWDDWD